MHSSSAEVIAVCLHDVGRQFHVMEHTLEFDRELEATFDFKLGKHVSFSIVIGRSVVKEAFCQVNLIISFEYVLLCDEPEQAVAFIQGHLDFGVCFLGTAVSPCRDNIDNMRCSAPLSTRSSDCHRCREI